jgi:hypothetical protein
MFPLMTAKRVNVFIKLCCLTSLVVSFTARGALIQDLDGSLAASVKTNASGMVTNWVDQSSAVD